MAPAAEAVFGAQVVSACFRISFFFIQDRDPAFSTGKAGAAPQDIFNFFIRNRKCGGPLALRILVYFFDLLFFRGEEIQCQLLISSAVTISSA